MSKQNGFFQSTQFVVYFLQFAFGFAGGNYPCPRLINEFIITAEEGTYHNSMIALSVETHKTNSAPIVIARCWLEGVDQFHGFKFRRSAQCTGRKSFGH